MQQALTTDPLPARDRAVAMRRGALGKCPNCGEGRMFRSYLQVAEGCAVCGEAFHHHRADDAPAYLTILIIGHAFLPFILGIEEVFEPPIWLHVVLWGTLIPAACVALLRPVKGVIVGLQWASRMHGFGGGKASSDA